MMKKGSSAYRMIRLTSASTFHLSFKLSRYSIAARSLAVMMPSFSEALAFHIRMLPSSEPDITKRASAEYVEDETLDRHVQVSVRHKKKNATSASAWYDKLLVNDPSLLAISSLSDPNLHSQILSP